VCATLFHAICGIKPFSPGDPEARDVTARFPQLVESPREMPSSVPAEVVDAVRAGLDPDPAKRPLPHELAEALEPVLARQPRAVLAGFKVR
jgi:serine/threonine-protein kinase